MSTTAAACGGAWLWLQLPAISVLASCARDAARRNDPFTTFSPEEGRTMRAFAARILPSDDTLPGAEEAGAAWFADRALAGPFAGLLDPVRTGLADLDARAQRAHGVAFADADGAQQDAIMRAVEDTQFFFFGRMLTIIGTFSDPVHGGNRDHVGITLLDMEHAAAYNPPFGWYDAEHVRQNGGAA